MNHEEFDVALLGAYRAAADESPAPAIDERVLRAADMQASRRRRRRYWVPLTAAAALAVLTLSSQRMQRIAAPELPCAPVDGTADVATSGLLRLQPSRASHSTVADFLLDSNSMSARVGDADEVPDSGE